jgi:ComF family protein
MLTQWLKRPLDFLLPPLCLTCTTPVSTQGGLCPTCFEHIHFLSGALCSQCGEPFSLPIAGDARCAACIAHPPAFDKALAVCRYDKHSRPLITRLKYNDQLHLVPPLAAWMVRAGAGLLERSDMIIPVPMHYHRQVGRMHNQAALLAQKIAQESGVHYAPLLLERVRATAPQTGKSRTQRQKNMVSAFRVDKEKHPTLSHATVLLIDDVMTTGATLGACAKALKKAGAARVWVLTFARTCRTD